MFKNIFSFNGRIRRTEYGISLLISGFISIFTGAFIQSGAGALIIVSFLITIFMIIIMWAQGAKRLHDIGDGMSGWWQLIPFMPIYMLFAEGRRGPNQYGEDPKGLVRGVFPNNFPASQPGITQNGGLAPQQWGYSGGHNNTGGTGYSNGGSTYTQAPKPNSSQEFGGGNPYAKNQ